MTEENKRPISHRRPAPLPQFYYGAAYYPEHWPTEYLERDAELMSAAGFNVVRLGEFAWHLMEPEEGRYDFSLFDRAIKVLAKHGIKAFMCTPTAAPPRWLTSRYPEVLRIDRDGRSMLHGSRQHACQNNPRFREFSRRITEAMAKHFGANQNVAGWQTDNEIHCHFSECHCPACQEAFRDFLSKRYGDIITLNRAWGTDFWALSFDNFSQIETPRPDRPTYSNPSHRLDYLRFLAASAASFQREQIEILRAEKRNWLIFHNGCMQHVDYRGDFGRDLDVLGFDIYPFFTNDPEKRRDNHAFMMDYVRAHTGNFIVPEHQSGPGGQPPYMHDTAEPGEMRKLVYVSLAHGADSLSYFRWRTCRFGAEEYWCGIIDHDNIPRRRYEETASVGKELAKLGPQLLGTSVAVDCAVMGQDYDAFYAQVIYPLGLPDSRQQSAGVHRWLYRNGYAVGCVHPEDDLSGIKLFIIPNCEIFRQEWLSNLEPWIKAGGVLVIGARSGTRTIDNQITAEPLPGILSGLAGITIEEYGRQNHPESRPLFIALGNRRWRSELWYETLKLHDARPFAMWDSRFIAGQTAASIRHLGKGKVIYFGTCLTDATVEELMPELVETAGLSPQIKNLPPEIECVRRTAPGRELVFLINHSDSEVSMPVMPEGKVEIGSQDRIFEPYGVKVISVRK